MLMGGLHISDLGGGSGDDRKSEANVKEVLLPVKLMPYCLLKFEVIYSLLSII